MTIVPFPTSAPSTQAVLAVIYQLQDRFPGWSLELDVGEDGRPCVTAEHRSTGGNLLAHWSPGGWAVLTASWDVVCQSPDLSEALSGALA